MTTNLFERGASALKWNFLGSFVRVFFQLGIAIALARVLGPEPFGLIAIAWLILGLGNLLADFGLSAALIQKATLNDREIRHAFTAQVFLGSSLTLITYAAAPSLATFFNREDATTVLRWMGLLFLLQAFGQTATALLRRDLNFKRVQLLQTLSYLVAYLPIGLPLAFIGGGVWSLVTAQLVQTGVYAIAVYGSVRHPLAPSVRGGRTDSLSFGSKVLASNLTSWGYFNLDSAIVGRALGVVDLGLYSRAVSLLSSPALLVAATLQGVLFPIYSRVAVCLEDVRRIYKASLCLLLVPLFPAFAAIAAIPDTTIVALYGYEWVAAGPLVVPIALGMPLYAVLAMGGPMMQGLGRAGMDAYVQLFGIVVMAVAVSVAARQSIEYVAWAVLGVHFLRAFLVTLQASRLVGLRPLSAFRVVAAPAGLALAAAATAWATDALLSAHHSLIRLVASMAAAGAVVLLAMLLFGRSVICSEAKDVLGRLLPKLPRPVSWVVRYWCSAGEGHRTPHS